MVHPGDEFDRVRGMQDTNIFLVTYIVYPRIHTLFPLFSPLSILYIDVSPWTGYAVDRVRDEPGETHQSIVWELLYY